MPPTAWQSLSFRMLDDCPSIANLNGMMTIPRGYHFAPTFPSKPSP